MKKRNRLRKRVLSVAKCIRPYRRNLFLILVLSVCLSSCAGLSKEAVNPMMPASTEFTFEQYEDRHRCWKTPNRFDRIHARWRSR